MAIDLAQEEADRLINLEKHAVDEKPWYFPIGGKTIHVPLISADKRESFLLDLARGKLRLQKVKFQTRVYGCIPLVRLDLDGSPHRNPDGTEIPCPHIHIYTEGYGTKIAIQIPPGIFRNLDDVWNILEDFMKYCHITREPNFTRDIFT